MKRYTKRILFSLAALVAALLLVAGGYVVYLSAQYSRVADHTPIAVERNPARTLQTRTPYTALTYNIGFGAYDHAFSFFMDAGVMKDGTKVTGTQSRAASYEVVDANTAGVAEDALALRADFQLFQEVDVNADRSHHVNQRERMERAFPDAGAAFALNFHSAYLAYPPLQPHGAVQSGLLTLTGYHARQAEWRSYPVSQAFPAKFFDLDRGFTVLRLPVEGSNHALVLINSHMSAFDEGGVYRALQLALLGDVLRAERAEGNWVVVGGDFNHAIDGGKQRFDSQQSPPAWVATLDADDLPEGFSVVAADNHAQVPTCRSTDLPYTPGVNYTVVVDGFIVSDNVRASAQNIDLNFTHSDHNPVKLTFTLE